MTTFAIASSPTFTAPVSVTVAGTAADGKPETHKFVAEFKRLDRTEYDELLKSGVLAIDALRDLLVGWSELTDTAGTPVPFSPQARDSLLLIAKVPTALANAFLLHSSDAELKN